MDLCKVLFVLVSAVLLFPALTLAVKPHIVFIVADDLGWNDVSWNNPDMRTPNLDSMATNGVLLNYSYAHAVCTPSRSAFMSGRHPFSTGLQVGSIASKAPKVLPSKFTLFPEKLQEYGYSTHMVGKWHLGFCNWSYTPTERGFDSFVGFYNGHEDYYTHIKANGYDLRFNRDVYSEPYTDNKYATDIFSERAVDIIEDHDPNNPLFLYLAFSAPHSPLQVPQEYIDRYENDTGFAGLSDERQKFCGMVTALDDAIGDIKDALTQHGFMNNTIIIFTSDNGAQPNAGGNNSPLRGTKGTYWEGGTRVPTFLYFPNITDEAPYVSSELFHNVDWYPTILSMAGGNSSDWNGTDGFDQWDTIRFKNESERQYIIYNIDYTQYGYAAIRNKNFKLVIGDPSPGSNNNGVISVSKRKKRDASEYVYSDDELAGQETFSINRRFKRSVATMLFKIDTDISEDTNELGNYDTEQQELQNELDKYTEVTPQMPSTTNDANPGKFGGVWSPGWCETDTLYT